jgi:hypothetical protein
MDPFDLHHEGIPRNRVQRKGIPPRFGAATGGFLAQLLLDWFVRF